ncbi:transposase IS4 family protein [Anaeromyxobacter sp. K]|uniref:IS4-like element ISAnsp7 family transposase n=1 Tax=Anaeromyxobacter sp. (strain K) TaxID=447217 RepID=UPI00015F8D86|nr:IS4-like element ISAnsp7 family transposase [Anaeromyxobacter sp. K]ACG75309.1 transposase IS4 family protein [Anaeromyxobacter sp. K]
MSDQPLDRDRITKLVSTIFAEDLHAKRVASLAGAAVGVLEGAALGIHAIGNSLAVAEGLKSKHAVKQVDRMLSNEGIPVWRLFGSWVPCVVGDRLEIVVALDWTDFDEDDQSTIALSMITSHGRATPLLWKTVMKSELKGWRNEHEDVLLERFREVLPEGVKVTVLADRGFGDQALYELLKDQLGFGFIVRFRGVVKVTSAEGETRPAKDWVPSNGRTLRLRSARVTKSRREIGAVVCVKAKGMKEAWHLATSHGDKPGSEIVALYARRFTIEESFRDQKNLRFGMGLSETRIADPARRDRLLLVSAVAIALLTILGAAGEALGLDKWLKTNTVKRRTISLLRQGMMHYAALPKMKLDMLEPLMAKFGEMLRAQRVFREVFGLI